MKGQHSFSMVPRAEIQRSRFDRSHGLKTTFDAGYLVPIFADEALPGDTFTLSFRTFGRLATPVKPIMDNLYMDVFFFAVPMRLLWTNFQRFMGERDPDPDSSTDYVLPTMTAPAVGGYTSESLSDYLGIPTGVASLEHVSLWHRAYNLIWNQWFRDQNLQDSVVVDLGDGPDDPADYVLLKRGKRHDYFTSCLPWPQKGDAVPLSLGDSAPIFGEGMAFNGVPASGNYAQVYDAQGAGANLRTLVADTTYVYGGSAAVGTSYLAADLSSATSSTINELRQAFQLQRLLERDARGGTRYTELVKAHFGVVSPDARLQRPEFLGGGTQMLHVTPIAQTSSTDVTTPQGNLAAMGTVNFRGNGFSKSFTEHTVILGLAMVRADLSYQQGLPRMFSRSTKYDFYWPALAHIGEQTVLNKEIYAQGTGDDDLVFGYQERYAEYRYAPSRITGKFRSTDPASLDVWHLSQEFGALPVLNASFIEENPPVDRVVVVPSEPHILLDVQFDLVCARPMPLFGVPGMIDHF